jgi:pyruvate dehydrogenase E1 component
MAATVPNCVSYDPTYGYELAVIIQDGMRRMYEVGENVFYYITTMNENYHHPDMPEGVTEGIVKGAYALKTSTMTNGPRVQLMGAGTILREVEAAAAMLEKDYGVAADVWSLTSINELARDGADAVRWNRLHPMEEPQKPYITSLLANREGPTVIATDYIKAYSEQLREFIPGPCTVLGTDGFGRSDTRKNLRQHFEVSSDFIVIAALKALVDDGVLQASVVAQAIEALGVDVEKINPRNA